MMEFIDYINIRKIHLMPSGYLYMMGEKNNFWFIRYIDGVELAKRPIILKDRLENKSSTPNYKDPIIDRSIAFDRLIEVGVFCDDMNWYIAGLDISDEELYRKSVSVYESAKSWRVKRMFDFIMNMAKMSQRFGKGELRMNFLGDGEMDSDKQPHLHYQVGKQSLASIDLTSGNVIVGDLPQNYRKDILKCVKANLLYYKFCWDYLTNQSVFADEYAGRVGGFHERLHKENPNFQVMAKVVYKAIWLS